jgi:hypothetical protein
VPSHHQKTPTKAVCIVGPIAGFTKERKRPETGSVPDLLRLFEHELRFYREIAPGGQDPGPLML